MRLLVAARTAEPADWCWCVAGELVHVAAVHEDLGEHCNCGCVVAFIGLVSGKGTTTATVADLDMNREHLELIVADYLATFGDVDPADVDDLIGDLLDAADPFPVGALVRRHLDHLEAV